MDSSSVIYVILNNDDVPPPIQITQNGSPCFNPSLSSVEDQSRLSVSIPAMTVFSPDGTVIDDLVIDEYNFDISEIGEITSVQSSSFSFNTHADKVPVKSLCLDDPLASHVLGTDSSGEQSSSRVSHTSGLSALDSNTGEKSTDTLCVDTSLVDSNNKIHNGLRSPLQHPVDECEETCSNINEQQIIDNSYSCKNHLGDNKMSKSSENDVVEQLISEDKFGDGQQLKVDIDSSVITHNMYLNKLDVNACDEELEHNLTDTVNTLKIMPEVRNASHRSDTEISALKALSSAEEDKFLQNVVQNSLTPPSTETEMSCDSDDTDRCLMKLTSNCEDITESTLLKSDNIYSSTVGDETGDVYEPFGNITQTPNDAKYTDEKSCGRSDVECYINTFDMVSQNEGGDASDNCGGVMLSSSNYVMPLSPDEAIASTKSSYVFLDSTSVDESNMNCQSSDGFIFAGESSEDAVVCSSSPTCSAFRLAAISRVLDCLNVKKSSFAKMINMQKRFHELWKMRDGLAAYLQHLDTKTHTRDKQLVLDCSPEGKEQCMLNICQQKLQVFAHELSQRKMALDSLDDSLTVRLRLVEEEENNIEERKVIVDRNVDFLPSTEPNCLSLQETMQKHHSLVEMKCDERAKCRRQKLLSSTLHRGDMNQEMPESKLKQSLSSSQRQRKRPSESSVDITSPRSRCKHPSLSDCDTATIGCSPLPCQVIRTVSNACSFRRSCEWLSRTDADNNVVSLGTKNGQPLSITSSSMSVPRQCQLSADCQTAVSNSSFECHVTEDHVRQSLPQTVSNLPPKRRGRPSLLMKKAMLQSVCGRQNGDS